MRPFADSRSWYPGYGSWIALAAVILTGLIGNWAIASGLMVLLLAQAVRPLDFLLAFVIATAGASFVFYEGGKLAFELALLSGAIAFMLICYLISQRDAPWRVARSRLAVPLLLYSTLSVANFAKGLLVGHPPKHVLVELIPVLAVASSLLVANAFNPRRDLRLAVWGLVGVAFANAILGFYAFSVTHTRAAGVYFTPLSGVVALLLVNLALRSVRGSSALAWTMLSLPLFLHQFLSFTRGMWLGCLIGLAVSVLALPAGRESGARWRRAGFVLGALTLMGVGGAVLIAVISGRFDILELAGSRFQSIGGFEFNSETASNVARLVEYDVVLRHIQEAPWLGYGLGYTFLVREPIGFELVPQWFVHQNYLLVWLKQGIVGLVLFLWVLWSAIRLGLREARSRTDSWESAWLATGAVATVYLAVLAVTNFPFDQVHSLFALALLWGGAMAMTHSGFVELRWRVPPSPTGMDP